MKIQLVTYGNDAYKKQKLLFKEVAESTLLFNSVKIFTPDDLTNGFKAKFSDILQVPKGGGYWIWKPYIIKELFDRLSENDILIYCDAGCLINVNGKERLDDYIDIIKKSPTGTLAFDLTHEEYKYTKQEVFDYFGCKNEVKTSGQLMGTVLLFRKCKHSSFLIDTWLKVLYDDPILFTDKRNDIIQHKDFIDHRHDQSIFSVIRKQYGVAVLPDETWFKNFMVDGKHFPFWATRLKD